MGAAERGLIIFAICIFLFLTEWIPMATAAILGCIWMVLFQVAEFSEVFGQFSSSSVILVVSMMILGDAMFRTGVAGKVGAVIFRFSGGSERRLLLLSVCLAAVVSAFLSNVATLAMFMAVFGNIQRENERMDLRNLMLPVSMACVVGGAATLVGSAPQMTAQNLLLEATGRGFRFFDFSFVGIALVLVLVVYVTGVGYPLGKKIWGGSEAPEPAWETKGAEGPAGCGRQIVMLAIFGAVVILFLWEPVPLPIIGAGGAVCCILFRCTTQKEAIEAVGWSSVLKLAGCLGLMQAVRLSGGGQQLAEWIFALIGDEFSPWFLFVCAVVLTQLLSEFLTNGTALVIVLPVVLSICEAKGFGPYPFAMGITLASSIALCTPLSNTPLTMVGVYGYRFRDYVRYSLGLDILLGITNILLVPVFFPFE
ncbi:SLC13 family permease [Hominifimenecus sp. rT4P-3]|uniref:SLC13 family permease n=1 Tax=Hominifimenecus sp. rT4P-3 TaxID=3242979 RepID=UPI003DA681B7